MLSSFTEFLIGTAVALLIVEQLFVYFRRRTPAGLLPGPRVHLPFVGGLVEMIRDPAGFWEKQRQYAPKGLSANYLMSKFMVFSADNDVNRAVLSNNGPQGFDMVLHPNGRMVLGDTNIAFMHGKLFQRISSLVLQRCIWIALVCLGPAVVAVSVARLQFADCSASLTPFGLRSHLAGCLTLHNFCILDVFFSAVAYP